MANYQDRAGVWAVWTYGNEGGPDVRMIFTDVVPAVREAESYEEVLFWPFEISLRDALEWWKNRSPLENSIIHFFYVTHQLRGTEPVPFCQDVEQDEWIQFDHSAIGKICPDCQTKIGRKIS